MLMTGDVLAAFLFVGGAIIATLAAYFFMRAVTGGDPETKDRDLANSVMLRISALHALILALVFAQEMIDYQQLRFESATEAAAIADVYFDAERYDAGQAAAIQKPLADYVRLVIDEEWKTLGSSGRLSPAAWAQWDIAYRGTLDLVPATDRQKSLRDYMLARIHTISETRVKRESHGVDSISSMFWFAAVSGVIFIALAYYSYPPARRNVMLISMFGAYTGIILFFIYAFSNPYSPPAALSPGAFERLQVQIERASGGG